MAMVGPAVQAAAEGAKAGAEALSKVLDINEVGAEARVEAKQVTDNSDAQTDVAEDALQRSHHVLTHYRVTTTTEGTYAYDDTSSTHDRHTEQNTVKKRRFRFCSCFGNSKATKD